MFTTTTTVLLMHGYTAIDVITQWQKSVQIIIIVMFLQHVTNIFLFQSIMIKTCCILSDCEMHRAK